ncbi:ThuA domain-containing protein [Pseudochryseolinea flava]|uniref:ThuA domain-containing protein n=1 Tax=Pseudochryseolinea flava TaxID=2059302 RepID=A0A364Y2B5_9BACT|nr:ThuA domain-containing protein [Pseudochryseolinea flava]RAW00896.1 ThuA domain-containing protein [Pseudochryseolinea flava]
MKTRLAYFLVVLFVSQAVAAQSKQSPKVIAFFTAKHDKAHISFVKEANDWFPSIAKEHGFQYDTTSNWKNLNDDFLKNYKAIIFLDTRPEDKLQREAFQRYIERGGGWMGFHFAAFALTPSTYNQDWDWYHNTFLGSGQYARNTWRPTSATLRVENRKHPATKKLSSTITASPNEWYAWEKDLRENRDITILLSVDPKSFPLGTGPKAHEIWHEGYFPVVWTNKRFKMIYINMGHNDMDYGGTNQALSSSFGSAEQNTLIIESVLWLISKKF